MISVGCVAESDAVELTVGKAQQDGIACIDHGSPETVQGSVWAAHRRPRLFHLVEHPQGLLEVGVEGGAPQIQDLNDEGAGPVRDLISGLAIGDQLLWPYHGEVLRDIDLLHAEFLDDNSAETLRPHPRLLFDSG